MKTNAKQLIIRQKNIITQVKCPQLPNIFRVKLIKFQDNDKVYCCHAVSHVCSKLFQ